MSMTPPVVEHPDDIDYANWMMTCMPYFVRRLDAMMRLAYATISKRSKFSTLSQREAFVLDAIYGYGHLGIPAMVEPCEMEPTHLSRVIAILEEGEYVVRRKTDVPKFLSTLTKDEHAAIQRRAVPHFTFRLTDKGRAARHMYHRALHAMATDILRASPDSRRDRKAFVTVAEKLFDDLDPRADASAMSDLQGNLMRELVNKAMADEEWTKLPILIEHVARPRPSGPVSL